MYFYGASGHAKVAIEIAEELKIPVEGLFDDNNTIGRLLNYPVLSPTDILNSMEMFISIGNNKLRYFIANKVKAKYVTLVHPNSTLSSRTSIGEGTVIMAGTIVQSDAFIGNHVILNTACTIDHECTIANFSHISPNSTLCGNVHIGEGTWIGAGSIILPGVKVGKWSVVGAGSVVDKDIPDNCLALGNRCKIIKYYNE